MTADSVEIPQKLTSAFLSRRVAKPLIFPILLHPRRRVGFGLVRADRVRGTPIQCILLVMEYVQHKGEDNPLHGQ